MKKLTIIKLYNKKGFGIAEVLIASTIIAIIIFTLTAAGRNALRSSIYLQERAQAIYMAQEGLEIMRQIRDSNWIDANSNTKWNSFDLSSQVAEDYPKDGNGKSYAVIQFLGDRYKLANITSNSSSTPELISHYGTDFHRQVILQAILNSQPNRLIPANTADTNVQAGTNSIKVTVKITWTSDNTDREVSTSEILTNWRPNY